MLAQRAMPNFAMSEAPQGPVTAVYAQRIADLYAQAGCDWVMIYGDREHAADITYLSNFDPRFEEAILVLGPQNAFIVGNEGLGYVSMLRIDVPVHLSQSLGLMGQDRTQAPRLSAVLHTIGLRAGARVGVVGWKYLEPEERDDELPAFVPSMVLSAIRAACGGACQLVDVTHCMTHPEHGLRSRNDAAQLAQFAWAAQRSAQAVDRIVRGARPGMSEHHVTTFMQYAGDPLNCHVMMSGDNHAVVGLRSPSSRLLAQGDAVTTAIGFRGGLCCRAGTLATSVADAVVRDYVDVYMRAQLAWYQTLAIGVRGGTMHAAVLQALAGAAFTPALNPGHLGSIDEWSHTPIRPGSSDCIASGMLLQCDIIPTHTPAGIAINCEDAVAVADASLRATLAHEYPELWATIEARRNYLREALGIVLAAEVLPLSLANARYAPAWLAPDYVWVNA